MLIDVGGHRLHAELMGSGDEVVVLVHGLASHAGTWDAVAPILARRRRVLVFDQRGHGASEAPAGPWTLDDLSGDLAALLAALALPASHVVGHSGGGVVAMCFAIEHSSRLDRLVVASAASQANAKAAAWYEGLARKAEERGGRAILGDFGWPDDAPAPDAHGFARAARCMGSLHERPLTPRLGAITRPTTVLVGSDDFIGPGGSVIIQRNIPGSALHILPGRGHNLHLEDPPQFARLVDDALTSSTASPSASR